MLKRIGIAVVASLVALEVTLQVAGLLAPLLVSRAREPGADAEVTILCVGDSHTFGAPLPESDSYPAQLQRSLRTRYGKGVHVVNLGVPGANSAMIANRLEKQIAAQRPDLVIAWAGVNSLWNPTETESWEDEPTTAWRSLLFRSKLVRLAAIAWYSLTAPTYERPKLTEWDEGRTVYQYGTETLVVSTGEPSGPLEETRRGVERDVLRMVDIARRYDVPILLVTYPYDEVPAVRTVNDAIRSVALVHGVDVVDTHRALARAFADGYPKDSLIVNAAGPHPRAILYRYIVENMLPAVNRLAWPADDCDEDDAGEAP